MSKLEDQWPWTNTFWLDGEELYQEEHEHTPLNKGDGFIDARQDYRRFRVSDVWYSTDNHGFFNLGRHVFLVDVTGTEDDLPGKIAPQYFSS